MSSVPLNNGQVNSKTIAAVVGGAVLSASPGPRFVAPRSGAISLLETTGNKVTCLPDSVPDKRHLRDLKIRRQRAGNSSQLQGILHRGGRDAEANEVRQCGQLWGYQHSGCGGVMYKSLGISCQNALCAYCQHERAARLAADWSPVIEKFKWPAYWVVTLKRYVGESLSDAWKRFDKSFRRLRRHPEWKRHVTGYVCSYEIARSSAGWGPHANLIVDCEWWEWADLVALWHSITGDSTVVRVKRIGVGTDFSLRDAISEVIKYVCKPAEIMDDDEAAIEFLDWVAASPHRHMFVAGGSAWGGVKAHREQLAAEAGITVDELDLRDAEVEALRVSEFKELEDTCPHCGGRGDIVPLYGVVKPRWECVPLNDVWWGPAPPGGG